MRLVEKAVTRPSRCAVLPYIGQTHEKGFIDTGSEIPSSATDSHIYVSVVAVEEMARLIGMAYPEYLESENERLQRELDSVREQLAEADKELTAIDTLKNGNWRPAKSAGRPRKVENGA